MRGLVLQSNIMENAHCLWIRLGRGVGKQMVRESFPGKRFEPTPYMMLPPSSLVSLLEGGLVDLRMCASNDINVPSKLARCISVMGSD